jgi:hypothetical protein
MAIPEKLLLRQSLQRSAREWLRIYREELQKTRPHGLAKDGRAKSQFSPVNANSIGSGRALDAGYEIVVNDDGTYDIIFGLPDYIYNLDAGVKPSSKYGNKPYTGRRGGSSPFLKSIMNWIETKGIRTELSTMSLAFAIRTNILNEGIEATNIISTINERFLEEYGEQIADDYMVNIEDYIIDNMKRVLEKYN